MLPDRVSNPGPLTYESGALPIALRGPDHLQFKKILLHFRIIKGMPQRGQILSCKCTSSHALGAQCNQWNVDYHIHPTVICSGFKLCRTIFEN